ncbi:MAG: hypothetical protein LC720_05825 [Actinobacteria bacterium]|nr:hypothetical protein [Actinomycetota bacterium]
MKPPPPRPAAPTPTARGRGRAGAILVVLLLGVSPGIASAQDPFAPLPSQPTSTPTTATPTTSTTTGAGGSLSSIEQIGLFAAALLLIGGIAFLIRRDAGAHAPAGKASGSGPRATIQPRGKRVERSRAKAKAARRQRKRTRAR